MSASRMLRRLHLLVGASLLVTVIGGRSLQAQTVAPGGLKPESALTLTLGQWHGGVDGTSAAVRAELPLSRNGRWLLVPGVTYSHYNLQDTPVPVVDVLVPEALIQFQLRRGGWVRPYVGAGGGLALINMFHTFDPVLTLGAGVRADFNPQWGARLDLEARSFGFQAQSIGWSIGLARHF
jgi:hypothetical protein